MRPYLPPPYNTSGRDGHPVWTLTKSTKTGNEKEAQKIARRDNHQGTFDLILEEAKQNREAANRDAGIDWVGRANQNLRDDLSHTDVSEHALRTMLAAYQQRMSGPAAPSNQINEILSILKGEKPPAKLLPVPFDRIVDDWAKNKKPTPAPDTISTFGRYMRDLAKHAGHNNAVNLTPQEIEDFRNDLLKAGKADTTVHNILSGISVILNWAVFKKMIPASPMGQVVIGGRPASERDEPYTVEHVTKIVLEGRNQPDEIRIPTLIAAYGGQRLSEILDASTHDIVMDDGYWCIKIQMKYRAKGTRLKNLQSERIIPLHPSIVDEVLAYRDMIIKKYGHGPLFPMVPTDELNRRGPSGGSKIAYWIRKRLGITEKDIAPMHGFRHYVRTQLYMRGVDEKTKDSITGHSDGPKVSRKYEHVPNVMKAKALTLLPDPLAMAR